MNLTEMLDTAFEQFLANTVSDTLLRSIRDAVTVADVDILIAKVASLDDPSAYCKSQLDRQTPAGFFLFLDFVSALIINLRDPGVAEAAKYGSSRHPFVPWVVKYVSDERFHDEIVAKFDGVFAE